MSEGSAAAVSNAKEIRHPRWLVGDDIAALHCLGERSKTLISSSPHEERMGRGPRRGENVAACKDPPLPGPLLHRIEEREQIIVTLEILDSLLAHDQKLSAELRRKQIYLSQS